MLVTAKETDLDCHYASAKYILFLFTVYIIHMCKETTIANTWICNSSGYTDYLSLIRISVAPIMLKT